MSNYVEVELDGKNRKIKYDYNALSDLEDKAGVSIMTLVSGERMGFGSLRLLLWSGLKTDEPGITLQRAGALLQKHLEDGKDLTEIAEACIEVLKRSGLLGKGEGNGATETAS